MKKLLLGAIATLASVVSTTAQTTLLFQSNATVQTTLPSGWSNDVLPASDPTNLGWHFGNAFPAGALTASVPAHGYYAYVDDYDNNTTYATNYDTLYLPTLNCTSAQHVFISLDLMFWYNVNNGYELGRIAISTNGGAWQTAVHLGAYGSTTAQWLDSLEFDISSYAAGQSNVRIAITYDDASGTVGSRGYGMAVSNIDVFEPLNYDLSTATETTPYFLKIGQAYTFAGTIDNFGGDTVSSFDMHYKVNGGATQSQTLSGISGFGGLTYFNWTMNSAQFTPPSAGTYSVKFWADNLNGSNVDQNHSNDTLTVTFQATTDVTTRQSLYEEFTGQSCVYCMIAGPNLDSVSATNASNSNIIKYHVPIPGRDFMYNVTNTSVDPRTTYYGVTGAPEGFLDGSFLNPSAYQNPPITQRYSSTTVQAENATGSVFGIDINSASFDAAKDSFSISGNITSYAAFSSGLILQVALTLDSVTYKYDLSQDDPTKSFAAPIGTSAAGYSYTGAPDSYYPYVLKFPHVLEQMLPSASGTSLNAFTAGSSQPFTFGWKQNHQWGQYQFGGGPSLGDSTVIDYSSTGQFVVFVQTDNAIPGYNMPAGYVLQSASHSLNNITGMQEISNGVSFEMYPNPTNNITTLAFKLDKSQDVNVEVYNMLGQQVYSVNEGNISAGMHTIPVNCSTLQNGMYFVKFNADNVSTTNKLLIQR